MNKEQFIKDNFGISEETIRIVNEAECSVADGFRQIEENCEINQLRVMKAFSDNRVSETCFLSTTGYGYDDLGRETLDKVYAQAFDAEDALVRHNFISGTHAISTALFAVLRPGDTLLSVTGKPYDTLEEVIGIRGEGGGSLKDFGVEYIEVKLLPDGNPDLDTIKHILFEKKIKAAEIQRSRGYGDRPSYSAEKIGELIKFIKEISPKTICIVDNCYGEFVDTAEPTRYGADLIIGSLIKNVGGGLAPTGGYIAGKKKYIELCANRLTSVGIGREAGASLGFNRQLFQGFFMAPHIVSQALKTALLCGAVFKSLGYKVDPEPTETRHDIIQTVKFPSEKQLISFCEGIQKGAPVDSFVTPEPWDMPGYNSKVIMAAGAFNQGASIELSADAPIKPPYMAYMQGGLTYESAKLGILVAADKIRKEE